MATLRLILAWMVTSIVGQLISLNLDEINLRIVTIRQLPWFTRDRRYVARLHWLGVAGRFLVLLFDNFIFRINCHIPKVGIILQPNEILFLRPSQSD